MSASSTITSHPPAPVTPSTDTATSNNSDSVSHIPSITHQFLLPNPSHSDYERSQSVKEYLTETLGEKFVKARDHDDSFEFSSHNFGTLNIKMPVSSNTAIRRSIHWIVNVDRSASMYGKVNGKTKLENIKHMLNNLIDYLKALCTDDVTHHLSIIGFDHEAEIYCNHINVGSSDEDIYEKYVNPITCRGSTNFSEAFEAAHEVHASASQENSGEMAVHIFLTDGYITCGSRNLSRLVRNCREAIAASPSFAENRSFNRTYFVGFGNDHDAMFLNDICNEVSHSQYYFVENIENAGFVYGEIVNDVLNEAMHSIYITTTFGEIFDFETNSWVNQLYISSLPIEVEKTFNIRMAHPAPIQWNTPRNIKIEVRGYLSGHQPNAPEDQGELRLLSQYINRNINYPNQAIEKDWWRQSILENMNTIKMLQENNREGMVPERESHTFNLTILMNNLKEWAESRDLSEDLFIQCLCDDICCMLKSLNCRAEEGFSFVNARLLTQGYQRAYNVGDFTALNSSAYATRAAIVQDMHVPSLQRLTSYSSSSQNHTMHSIGGHTQRDSSTATVKL